MPGLTVNVSGFTKVGFSSKKTNDLFSHRLWKVMTFFYLSSPHHPIFPCRLSSVLFLNSPTKKLIKKMGVVDWLSKA